MSGAIFNIIIELMYLPKMFLNRLLRKEWNKNSAMQVACRQTSRQRILAQKRFNLKHFLSLRRGNTASDDMDGFSERARISTCVAPRSPRHAEFSSASYLRSTLDRSRYCWGLKLKNGKPSCSVRTFCTKINFRQKKSNKFGMTKCFAFTLAEVLITLSIIGIIAEYTIPILISSVQDAQYKTGKDKVRMSVAEAGRILSVSGDIDKASSAEDFVKNYLSKQLKIVKFCAPADMEQCGMPSGNPTKFKNEAGTEVTSMKTTWTDITAANGVTGDVTADNSYAPYSTSNPTTTNFKDSYTFLSADGIAVNLFYNPYCLSSPSEKPYYNSSSYKFTDIRPQFSLDTACMSGVYDMNGLKSPNQVGRDIGFFGVFYNGNYSTSAAALPYKEGYDSGYDWPTSYTYCQGIKGYKLPTVDELSAIYLGRNITGLPKTGWMWTASSVTGSSASRDVYFGGGNRGWDNRSTSYAVRCVRD